MSDLIMGDFKKIVGFIILVFALLFGLAMLGKAQEDVLANYNPIQSVRPTTAEDRVEVYDSIIEFYTHERVRKPYVLVTQSEDDRYVQPKFRVIDYGTYKEIDSLKCIRYKQMQWKMYHLEKLNEKSCE